MSEFSTSHKGYTLHFISFYKNEDSIEKIPTASKSLFIPFPKHFKLVKQKNQRRSKERNLQTIQLALAPLNIGEEK